jgi:hypothetical protein
MAIVKVGFSRLNVPDKIQSARNIIAKMTGNAKFPAPVPTLAAITTAVNSLETAYEGSRDGGKSKTALVNVQSAALNTLMSQLTAYVQQASGGDEITILSSGMEVKAPKTPPQPLEAPTALSITTGKTEGAVLLKWQPVTGAKAYVTQQSADGTTAWTNAANSTKSTAPVTGLTTGAKVWFRVAALGPKGQGPWCEPTRGMAG